MICDKGHNFEKLHKTGGCPVCYENIKYLKYTREHKEKVLLKKAKHRAKVLGLEFNIDINDVVIPEYCPVLGLKILKNSDIRFIDNSPSLDRIDINKGYVKGNVKVISIKANRLKNNATIEETKKILKYMEDHILIQ
jgi:hypothetical protein